MSAGFATVTAMPPAPIAARILDHSGVISSVPVINLKKGLYSVSLIPPNSNYLTIPDAIPGNSPL